MNVKSYCTKYYLLSDTKQLNTLNNIAALLKGVLFDLQACNFVHARISLHARCTHAHHQIIPRKLNFALPLQELS